MAIPRLRRLTLAASVALVLGAALWLLASSSHSVVHANASTLFVKPTGTGTACSQAAPCTLQTAAARALAGDVIYLAAGTYQGAGAGAVVTVTGGYTLYGGWNGAASGRVWRDPATYVSVVDGQNARQGVHIAGAFVAGVDGLTISSGRAEQGGGIFAVTATVFIRNNVITACQTITWTTYGYGRGAGICILSAGGGVIAHNVIAGNTSGYGGAIYRWYVVGMTIEDNDIYGNVARKRGGGIVIEGPPDTIRGNRVYGNSAAQDGGGALIWNSAATLDGNSFLNNSAPLGGGLLMGEKCRAKVVNNWIIQSSGDGIYEVNSNPCIANNTIVGHATPEAATGIRIRTTYPPVPPWVMTDGITNNIVSGFSTGIKVEGAVTPTLDYNDVWNNNQDYVLPVHVLNGTHSIALDPRFVDAAGGDYHLSAASPCINAGDPAGVPPAPPLDVDGDARPAAGRVDIGADEFTGFYRAFLPCVVRQAGP